MTTCESQKSAWLVRSHGPGDSPDKPSATPEMAVCPHGFTRTQITSATQHSFPSSPQKPGPTWELSLPNRCFWRSQDLDPCRPWSFPTSTTNMDDGAQVDRSMSGISHWNCTANCILFPGFYSNGAAKDSQKRVNVDRILGQEVWDLLQLRFTEIFVDSYVVMSVCIWLQSKQWKNRSVRWQADTQQRVWEIPGSVLKICFLEFFRT